jgi:DNA-binding XRE family transcriptional regulator
VGRERAVADRELLEPDPVRQRIEEPHAAAEQASQVPMPLRKERNRMLRELAAAVTKMAEMTARGEGFGKVLGLGSKRLCEKYGHPELSMSAKGLEMPAYDPRGMKGMGLGYATSNRGACHLRAYVAAAELGVMPFGSLKVDPLAWKDKGGLVKVFQDIHAFSDSMDLCKFSAFAMGTDEYAQQYSAMVGIPFTSDDVLKTGERIYNLERHYNNLNGFGAGSDQRCAVFGIGADRGADHARLSRQRIEAGLTQAELAAQAGLSKRTLERIEAGHGTELVSLIRVLRALKLTDGLDSAIAELPPSPIALLKLRGKQRRRAPRARPKAGTLGAPWTWRS